MHELNEIAHKNKNFMKSGSLFFNNLKQKYLNYIKIKTFFYRKVRSNPHRPDLFDRLRWRTVFIAVKQGKGVPENCPARKR